MTQHVLLDLSQALRDLRLGPDHRAPFPAGPAGLALAHATLERALPGLGHAAHAEASLARAIRAVARHATRPALYGGFTGVAWVAAFLQQADDDGDDACEAIDPALLSYVSRPEWTETYDLIGGLVGYGVYALERLPRPTAARIVEEVVRHLSAGAMKTRPGLSWRSRGEWVREPLRRSLHDGFNLGVAHGVPGVLAFLGRAARAGVAKREASRLLDGGVAWLLAQEQPAGTASAFGYAVADGATEPARSAWCYGDPGVACALLVAANASGEPSWRRAALRIGLRAAARPPSASGVEDASLCHGAAGMAHMFGRLHVETGDARFRRASRVWIDRTLTMRAPGDVRGRLAGFRSRLLPRTGGTRPVWRADASFLTGIAGIAMALAEHGAPPSAARGAWGAWDRVMLLSDSPRASARRARG